LPSGGGKGEISTFAIQSTLGENINLEVQAEHEADDSIAVHLRPEVHDAEDEGRKDRRKGESQSNGLFLKRK